MNLLHFSIFVTLCTCEARPAPEAEYVGDTFVKLTPLSSNDAAIVTLPESQNISLKNGKHDSATHKNESDKLKSQEKSDFSPKELRSVSSTASDSHEAIKEGLITPAFQGVLHISNDDSPVTSTVKSTEKSILQQTSEIDRVVVVPLIENPVDSQDADQPHLKDEVMLILPEENQQQLSTVETHLNYTNINSESLPNNEGSPLKSHLSDQQASDSAVETVQPPEISHVVFVSVPDTTGPTASPLSAELQSPNSIQEQTIVKSLDISPLQNHEIIQIPVANTPSNPNNGQQSVVANADQSMTPLIKEDLEQTVKNIQYNKPIEIPSNTGEKSSPKPIHIILAPYKVTRANGGPDKNISSTELPSEPAITAKQDSGKSASYTYTVPTAQVAQPHQILNYSNFNENGRVSIVVPPFSRDTRIDDQASPDLISIPSGQAPVIIYQTNLHIYLTDGGLQPPTTQQTNDQAKPALTIGISFDTGSNNTQKENKLNYSYITNINIGQTSSSSSPDNVPLTPPHPHSPVPPLAQFGASSSSKGFIINAPCLGGTATDGTCRPKFE